MRKISISVSLSMLVLATLACKTVAGLQNIQPEIPTILTTVPAMLTAVPTMLDSLPTESSSDVAPSTGGLGIDIEKVKTVLETTKQFTFTESSVDGQPALVAGLSSDLATAMPVVAESFSAVFIGDPKDISEIRISVPSSEDQAAVQTGLSMVTVIFAGILPTDSLISFLPWITENYTKLPVGGTEEMTAGKLKFTLSKSEVTVLLVIVPAP
ncbi:MAG: hypothetical protein WCK35_01675 [Chloroflexota bacterium]